MSIALKGMTWDHARGYDPMEATSKAYKQTHPEVNITWERRSLQAFADRPIAEMAAEYDLIVIDHPHVGEVARAGHLVAFDEIGKDHELAILAAHSIGPSHASYQYDNRQWALAIDAATPVAAFRADRLETPPETWAETLRLAKKGGVVCALKPINALMTFMGFARNMGVELAVNKAEFIELSAGKKIFEMMREFVALIDSICLDLDPIGIYDWMGKKLDAPIFSPYGYGYTNYSREGYAPYPLTFADAPGVGQYGPRGTVLGGTGIAVSSSSKHKETALDYAFWIAGAQCQSGLFFNAGGQPAHSAAWEDEACNQAARDFFRNTRKTLDSSWLRPRYDGYMGFQDQAGQIVHACIKRDATIAQSLAKLETAYLESRS